jgi:hypothetical protein
MELIEGQGNERRVDIAVTVGLDPFLDEPALTSG